MKNKNVQHLVQKGPNTIYRKLVHEPWKENSGLLPTVMPNLETQLAWETLNPPQ